MTSKLSFKKSRKGDYSRIPVGRGDLDHIVGMLDIKDLVGVDLHDPAFNLEGHSERTALHSGKTCRHSTPSKNSAALASTKLW